MVKLKYGIESFYAVHGWGDISAPDDIVWKWQLEIPGVTEYYNHVLGDRTKVEKTVFPVIEEDLIWTDFENKYYNGRYYDKRILNPLIVAEMNKLGYTEGKHWSITNRPMVYSHFILFSRLPVRTAFMKILTEIMDDGGV